jgi:hypothetical protein
MKNALILVLCLGILGWPLRSQGVATPFDSVNASQKGRIPDARALLDGAVPNDFMSMFDQPGLLSGPRVHMEKRKENLSTREENNAERDRIRRNRLISGLGLAGSWAATIAGDLFFDDEYRGCTLIPVIGPFITIAAVSSRGGGSYWKGAEGLLILSGVAQTAFATYFIISLAKKPKSSETKPVTIWPSLTSLNLRIQF